MIFEGSRIFVTVKTSKRTTTLIVKDNEEDY